MIAIFATQSYATRAANAIHAYLLENRGGYNALKWNDTNKSSYEEKWAVKIPPEFPQTLITGESEFIEAMPENWYPPEID